MLIKLVCRIVGHDFIFGKCKRCSKADPLVKIAKAMATPLKRPLDYGAIGRKLIQIDKIDD